MSIRYAAPLLLVIVAGCGSGGDTAQVDPIPDPVSPEITYTLASPPALRGLLWATDQQWPDPTADVVTYEFDLYLLDDRSNVIETVNRVSEETWRISRPPVLTADRRLVLFRLIWGDEPGLYAYDVASDQRRLVVPGLAEQFALADDRVLAWWERVRAHGTGPFERHLFVGSLDGSVPVTEITPDESYEVAHDGFDLSPDGEWLVWVVRHADDSHSLAAAPTADPAASVVLTTFAGGGYVARPQFIDGDRIAFENDGATMMMRLSDPVMAVRIDVEPDPGFRSDASTVVSTAGGAKFVYQVASTGMSFDDPAFRRHMLVASFDEPGVVRRVNPDDVVVAHDPGRGVGSAVWDLSDDGRWLAWISLDGDDTFSLWLSDLAVSSDGAQRVGGFTGDDAFGFLPGSSELLYTIAGQVHRLTPGDPFTTRAVAALPDEGRVGSIRGLPDGVHYLMAIEPDGWYGQRLWVGSLDGRPSRILVTGSPTDAWQEFDFFQLP